MTRIAEAVVMVVNPRAADVQLMRVYTIAQVARMAGVGKSRIRQLVAAGRFANAVKVAGSVFIPEDDVQHYLAWPDRRRKVQVVENRNHAHVQGSRIEIDWQI